MKIFSKRVLHTVYGYNIKQYLFLGNPFFESRKNNRKKIWNKYKISHPQKEQRIFYLKVNRNHQTAFNCIQHWLDVIARMDGYIYFVCDNNKMKEDILEKNYFYNQNFSFIKSDTSSMKKTLSKILSGCERFSLWYRIACAMMTPFIHAANKGYKKSYNIDADDIMILVKPEKIAKALLKAENYAEKKEIDCFNLDMFVSKSFGLHWSFGCVFVRTPKKVLDVIEKNRRWKKNEELIKKYKTTYIEKFNFNVDWLFTFLRDTKQLNLQTFYIENAYVVHMPDICISRHWAFAFQWHNNKLNFPILNFLYADELWGNLPIYKKCVKIDIDIDPYTDLTTYMNEFYSTKYEFELQILNYSYERGLISSKMFNDMQSKTLSAIN